MYLHVFVMYLSCIYHVNHVLMYCTSCVPTGTGTPIEGGIGCELPTNCYVYLLAVSNKIRLDKVTSLADAPMPRPAPLSGGFICSSSSGLHTWQPREVLQRYTCNDKSAVVPVSVRLSTGVECAADVVNATAATVRAMSGDVMQFAERNSGSNEIRGGRDP